MILGGTWRVPVAEGLLDEDFVEQLQMSGTYNEDSFDREYGSVWYGDASSAFFTSELFDRYRKLKQPEYKYSGRSTKTSYYIIGVDVGRFDCTTEAAVFKVTPQAQGTSIKTLVNLYTYNAEHFEDQAIHIKKLFFKFRARGLAIDANGVGAGFVDFMVKSQVDPETNDILPPFGVLNDEDGKYKKLRTADTVADAMFLIKATAAINSEIYAYIKTQMSSGKIKTLIDEVEAKAKLMLTKAGQKMTPEERNEYLRPFIETSILREQMLNMAQKDEDRVNIVLKQVNRKVKKDKFSAFMYGLYFIEQEEERAKKRRSFNIADLLLFSKAG